MNATNQTAQYQVIDGQYSAMFADMREAYIDATKCADDESFSGTVVIMDTRENVEIGRIEEVPSYFDSGEIERRYTGICD